MIYTLGYQGLAPARVREIVLALDAVLLDCRFKPVSRLPGFGHRQLEKLMSSEDGENRESRYVRMGDMLGGHGHTTKSGLQALQPYADDRAHCVLLCMEEHPADCHRHTSITGPHFPDALHIYRDRMFFSRELSRVGAGEIGFDELLSGSWDEWLAVLSATQ
jgi:hypothetical protein